MTIKAKLTVQMTGQLTLPETQALLAAVIIPKITVNTRTTLTRQAAHQTKIKSANNHHYFKSTAGKDRMSCDRWHGSY